MKVRTDGTELTNMIAARFRQRRDLISKREMLIKIKPRLQADCIVVY